MPAEPFPAAPAFPVNPELMLQAVALARRGFGHTAPNPMVGAVLVRDGQIVASGWHTACGQPHAEREALADAWAKGVDPAGCELYVTLEPCNHHGRTPPCTDAVLEAGITRVVVGTRDPNPGVAGGGVERLRSLGVEVVVGVAEEACRELIADFLLWTSDSSKRRAYLVLKLAQTLDGRIASRPSPSGARTPEAVSGPEAKAYVHDLRARLDAVLVGGATLRADDPQLSPRNVADPLPGALAAAPAHKDPLAVLATCRLPDEPERYRLLRERPGRTIFWTGAQAAVSPEAHALRALGCRVWELPESADGQLDLAAGLTRLRTEAGAYHCLCEGGGRLAWSLAEQGVLDELRLILAPRILGDEDAVSGFAGRGPAAMARALDFRLAACEPLGRDLCLTYRPLPAGRPLP